MHTGYQRVFDISTGDTVAYVKNIPRVNPLDVLGWLLVKMNGDSLAEIEHDRGVYLNRLNIASYDQALDTVLYDYRSDFFRSGAGLSGNSITLYPGASDVGKSVQFALLGKTSANTLYYLNQRGNFVLYGAENAATIPHFSSSPELKSVHRVELPATSFDAFDSLYIGFKVDGSSRFKFSQIPLANSNSAFTTAPRMAALPRMEARSALMTSPVLSLTGNGAVQVVSPSGSFICSSSCSLASMLGQDVFLLPVREGANAFIGWSSPCEGSELCHLNVTNSTNLVARFTSTPIAHRFVIKVGAGGQVTYLNNTTRTQNVCDSEEGECVLLGFDRESFTLTAQPMQGFVFDRWSGACSGTQSTCTVNLTSSVEVSALFRNVSAPVHELSVQVQGGAGRVISSDYQSGGIDCGSSCRKNYPNGQSVVLSAILADGVSFTGWGGACTGNALTCTVSMNAARTVTAQFARSVLHPILTSVTPSGAGTVTCSPNPVPQGGNASCMALPNAGYTFTGFSGDCSGTSCTLSNVTGGRSVTANFVATQPPPSATKTLDVHILDGVLPLVRVAWGNSSVLTNSVDLRSESNTLSIPQGSLVTLTAHENELKRFVGWSGACRGTDKQCSFILHDNIHVFARYVWDKTPMDLSSAVNAMDNKPWLTFTTSASRPWIIVPGDLSSDGRHAIMSGRVGDGESSWVETTLTGPGLLYFKWAVSSEAQFGGGCWDALSFYLNGQPWDLANGYYGICGEWGYTQETVFIPPGTHTVRWAYEKDEIIAAGADRGLLDEVRFLPLRQVDCLFDWGERVAPDLLPRTNGITQVAIGHVLYRSYPQSDNHFGVFVTDGNLYGFGAITNYQLLELGPFWYWGRVSGCTQ